MAFGLKCSLHEGSRFKVVMKYWLLKSEPDVWSIEQQIKAGIKGVAWDGV